MKKSIKIPLIILAGLIGSYLLLIAIGPYIILALHPLKLKADLNNPIINAHYSGWHKVTLDEHLQIKLPKDWTLEYGDRIVIRNGDGQTVALAERFPHGQKDDTGFLRLLSDCAGREVTEYTFEHFSSESAPVWFCIGNEEKVTAVTLSHCKRIENKDGTSYLDRYYYRFCFLGTDGGYCDEAEAIAWSMKDD